MLLIVWGVSAINIISDRKMLRRIRPPAEIREPLRILFQRNFQLFTLITLLMVIVGIHDWPPNSSGSTIKPLSIHTDTQSSTKPVPNTAPQVPKFTLSSTMPYLDIPEFNEKDGHEQAYIDFLNQRYEAWLVTYYYLHKCNQAPEGDLMLIKASLHEQLELAHAQNDVENNILSAALGSYQEMYKDVACDPASLANSKSSYLVNMQQLHDKNISNLQK